jgi:hypothetical protein
MVFPIFSEQLPEKYIEAASSSATVILLSVLSKVCIRRLSEIKSQQTISQNERAKIQKQLQL